jgi:hypothetical protein
LPFVCAIPTTVYDAMVPEIPLLKVSALALTITRVAAETSIKPSRICVIRVICGCTEQVKNAGDGVAGFGPTVRDPRSEILEGQLACHHEIAGCQAAIDGQHHASDRRRRF